VLHVPLIASTLFHEPFCISSVLLFIFATRITYKPKQRRRTGGGIKKNKERRGGRKRESNKERKEVRIKEKS